jgi:threonine 3-dehydrogenase
MRRFIFDPFGNAAHTAFLPVLARDVLITGAGPIGIMAAAIVRHAGARYVVITTSTCVSTRLKMGVTSREPALKSLKDVQKELGCTKFRCRLEIRNPSAFHDMLANWSWR